MKSSVIIFAFLLIAAQGAFAAGQPEKKDDAMMKDDAMTSGDAMMKDDAMMSDDGMTNEDNMMLKDPPGFYSTARMQPYVVPFTTPKAAQGYAAKGPTVYFFAATWCPTCQAAYKDLESNYRKLPAGATLVLVNYDTARALKDRYGVTTQHTFIQIDTKGNKIKSWVGSATVADIVKKISAM